MTKINWDPISTHIKKSDTNDEDWKRLLQLNRKSYIIYNMSIYFFVSHIYVCFWVKFLRNKTREIPYSWDILSVQSIYLIHIQSCVTPIELMSHTLYWRKQNNELQDKFNINNHLNSDTILNQIIFVKMHSIHTTI